MSEPFKPEERTALESLLKQEGYNLTKNQVDDVFEFYRACRVHAGSIPYSGLATVLNMLEIMRKWGKL